MSKDPFVTFYAASTNEAVEATWKLKRITETHDMRQKALMEEFKTRAKALTDEMQGEQSAVFESLRTEMNIPDADWGDGYDWAVNIEDLANGTVALVHDSAPSRNKDDCDCPVCQLRRTLMEANGIEEDEDVKVVH